MMTNQRAARGKHAVPYWEDRVYHYLSRRHRNAVAAGDDTEVVRLDGLIRELINASISDETYRQLEADARMERKAQKQERKRLRKSSPTGPSKIEGPPAVNVAELKKRIFNPQTSRENVIRALEALPPAGRKSIVAGLAPGLRKKLGTYLISGKR